LRKQVYIYRDENGVPHINAETLGALLWGQGYVHGTDRALQMLMMRILGQGRVCELLEDTEENLAVDIFFRRMRWYDRTYRQVEGLPNHTKSYLAHYCDGVNAALSHRMPWELRMLGLSLEPWQAEDSILLSRMMGYLTLAQSQGQLERLLVEMVRAEVSRERLEALFPGQLGGLDEELVRQVRLGEHLVPPALFEAGAAPRMTASNNWVVHGSRTASGKPILATDPHLEVNRLPAVWCEMALEIDERFAIGGTVPGLPGVLIGRTDHVTWGATYSYMDAVDSWIERCRDGRYERDGAWLDFEKREEVIRRKKQPDQTVTFYENRHGVLDGDPFEEGLYLATRWSAAESGAASIDGILSVLEATSAAEAMSHLGNIETAWSWVIADREGNIGYQMSGRMPKRRDGVSGLVPLPGWDPANDWQGFVDQELLPRAYNPEQGFLVTANNDLNGLGHADPINAAMGEYRAVRIAEKLSGDRPLNLDDMFRLQYDLHSIQAERFMAVLAPLLPDTEQADILRTWDYRYGKGSKGAYLFERVYRALLREVFGTAVGEPAARFVDEETDIFVDFYACFDRVLLSETSAWFGEEGRDALYRRVLETALEVVPRPWGEHASFVMKHLLFGGKLPRWLGFDRGPVSVGGGRATIAQCQLYRNAGRETSFLPSYRFVTDMAQPHCFTNLPGGPTDRRFSRWYASDLHAWSEGQYKTVTPEPRGERIPLK